MLVGDRIGEYRIDAALGAGGFGEVYRAHDVGIGRDVAIKILHARHTEDPIAVERFLVEARALAKLDDANIVRVHAMGRLDDGRHYQVMELLAGQSLEEWLTAQPRPSLADTLHVLDGLARGLDAAHAAAIVHRDVKPDNVMLITSDGVIVPKLIDFGLVKMLPPPSDEPASGLTVSGHIMGTPAYMSPEQCRGRAVDTASDVYAFGVVAYRMLTGGLPFSSEDPLELLLRHARDTPEPPSRREPALPAAVDDVLVPLLSKDASARPVRLAPVVVALAEALSGPVRARPQRRRRLLAAAIAAPVVALAGWLGVRALVSNAPSMATSVPAASAATVDAAIELVAPVLVRDAAVIAPAQAPAPPPTRTSGRRDPTPPSNPEAVEDPFRGN